MISRRPGDAELLGNLRARNTTEIWKARRKERKSETGWRAGWLTAGRENGATPGILKLLRKAILGGERRVVMVLEFRSGLVRADVPLPKHNRDPRALPARVLRDE